MYKIEWIHQSPLLNEQQQKLLEKQIAYISDELDRASDLIFHTVFLTEDRSGAIVIVDGREGYDDTVFLTYYEKPEWVTLDALED